MKKKYYVVKYALTDGILEVDGEASPATPSILNYTVPNSNFSMNHAHGNEWFDTLDAAKAQAEQMRLKKIASLEKQIAKLEKLVFAKPLHA